ncbi:MAG: hypothetical protein ACREKL_08545 [Chthoniobacterales bacterium]
MLANLELMPLKLNIRKSASVGQRQRDLLEKFESTGLPRRDPARSAIQGLSSGKRIAGDRVLEKWLNSGLQKKSSICEALGR